MVLDLRKKIMPVVKKQKLQKVVFSDHGQGVTIRLTVITIFMLMRRG